MTDYIQIATAEGAFGAYVADPRRPDAPAVVVLHEVFAVNADMRQTCDELAAHGFLALCPDLFWRLNPGLDLSPLSATDVETALKLYADFDRDAGVRDIASTIQAATTLDRASGRVGLMGFCLGGLMAYLTAARQPVDAAVAFHGGGTENYLDEADGLVSPLLMHLAEEDEYISKPAQARIKTALAGRANVTIFSYPGCSHAFARHGGEHYDARAAELATRRSRDFLRLHLD